MIQHHFELLDNIKKIVPFKGNCFIQKIYSTAFSIVIQCRFSGESKYLYLGRGHGVEGMWVGDEKPDPYLRKQDKFLQYLRKHLSSSQLVDITPVYRDRAICITYFKYGRNNRLFMFWKSRDLIFLHNYFDSDSGERMKLKSWEGKTKKIEIDSIEQDYEDLLEVGLNPDLEGRHSTTDLKQILKNELKRAKEKSGFSKKQKFIKRKVTNIEKDIEKAKSFQELYQKIDELDLSSDKIVFAGVKVKFPRHSSDYQKRDLIFAKLKSLKKIIPFLEERKQKALQELGKNNNPINLLNPISPIWRQTQSKVQVVKDSDDFDIFSLPSGLKFAVGRSASGNDQMRKKWARSADLWFHLEGEKSAHIIAKVGHISEISSSDLVVLASCLRDYSHISLLEIPLMFTQVKNLKGVKGVKGSVTFKKEKYLTISYNKLWKKEVS